MLRRNILGLLVSVACMGVATLSFAGIPDLNNSTAVTAAAAEVSVFNTPQGAGDPLSDAQLLGGTGTDATITVTLLDAGGNVVYLYPFEDLWLETSLGGMVPCNGGTVADFSSDINGETTFSGTLYAGGASDRDAGEKARVMVNGLALVGSDLDILFNSADINGDGAVNLSDVILFATPFLAGATDYAFDFYFDGVLNLSDLILLAGEIDTACP